MGDPATIYHSPHNTAKRMNGHAAETSTNTSYIGSMGLRDLGSKSFGSFGRNRNRGDLFRNKSFNSSVWRANGHGFNVQNDACDIYDEVFGPNNCSGSSIPALGDVWPRPSVTPFPKRMEVSERPVYDYDDEIFSKPPSSSDIDYDAIFKDDPSISIKTGEDRAVLELQRRTNPQTDAAGAQNGHASPDQMRKARDSSSSNGKSSSANGSLQQIRSRGDVSEVACQKLETIESSNGTYFPCIQSVSSPSHIRAKKNVDRSEYHAQNGGLISFQIKEDYTIEPSEEPESNIKCSPAISGNGLNHVASTLDNVALVVKAGNKVQNSAGLHENGSFLNVSERIRSLDETNLMELLKASSKIFPDSDFQKGNILPNGFIRNGKSEKNLIDKLKSFSETWQVQKKCVGNELIASVGSPNGHLENKHISKMQTDDTEVTNDIIFQFEIPGQNDVSADMPLGSEEGTGRKPLKTQELSRASSGEEVKQLDEEATKEQCIEAKTEEVRAQDGSLKPEGLDRSSSGKTTKQIHLELNKENPTKDIKQEGKAQTEWITVDKIKLLTRPSQVRPPSRPPPKLDTQVTGRQAIAKSVVEHTALLPLRPPPPLKVEMHVPGAQATPKSVLEHSVLLADEHLADDGHDISSNGRPLEAGDNQNTEPEASLKDGNYDMNSAGTGDNASTGPKMIEREELISIQVSCDAISRGNVVAKDDKCTNIVGSRHTDMAHDSGTRVIKRDEPQQKEENNLDGGIPMEKVESEFSISTMDENTERSALHTEKVSVPLRDDEQAKEVCPSAQYQEHNIPVDQCCISTQFNTTEEQTLRGTETEANAERDDRIPKNPKKVNMNATTEAEDFLTGSRSASDHRQHCVEEVNFAEEANGAETTVASDGNVEEGRKDKVEVQDLLPERKGRIDKENLVVEQENLASTIKGTNNKVEGQEHAPEIEGRVEKENLAPEEKEEKSTSTIKETSKKVEQPASNLEVNEDTATKLESCSMKKQIEPETNVVQGKAFEKQATKEQKLAEKDDEWQRNKTLTERTPQLRAKAAAEAKERLAAEARKRAERAAVERVTLEVRERAAAEARAKAQKAAAEKMMTQKDRISVQTSEAYRKDKRERGVLLDELEERQRKEHQEKEAREERERQREREIEREKDLAQEKAAVEAREKAEREREAHLRAERAAVERATTEARARLERAAKERAAVEARERAQRNASERQQQNSRASSTPKQRVQTQEANAAGNGQRGVGAEQTGSIRRVASFVNVANTAANGTQVYDFWEAEGENPERQKARWERHQRTAERVAKALAEKNQRDLELQREQAEKQRLAERLDADIKRWSTGKEGKLRALLSTLQYVLWQGSGWKSIPLNDLVNPVAVKKAYRKATLCLHPDKVQQKGATIQQKYIAEKVFDLLKDAWNRFSAEEQL